MILIILLSLCGPLQAEEGSAPGGKVPESGETSQETVNQRTSPPAPVWPKPFKPSEEIGADSQISFPTDI